MKKTQPLANRAATKLRAILRRGLPSLRNIVFAQFGYWPAASMKGHWLEDTPVYCISLTRATWRRQVIARQVEKMGLKSFQFVDAVDARTLAIEEVVAKGLYSPEQSKAWHANGLTLNEIACSLSHADCYRRIVERDHPRALIIEDDALFRCGRFRALQLNDLPDWAEIVFLNAFLEPTPPTGRISGRIFRDTSYNGSSAGYLLTRATAAKLLSEAVPVRHAADGLLGRALANPQNEPHHFRSKGSALGLSGVIIYPEAITNGSTDHYARSTIR